MIIYVRAVNCKVRYFDATFGKNVANRAAGIEMPQMRSYNGIQENGDGKPGDFRHRFMMERI